MVDSSIVLWGQTVAYTLYCLAILSLIAWFGYKVTKKAEIGPKKNTFFYVYVSLLIVSGVSLHIITYNTIPWVSMDLNRAEIKADKVFEITVANHQFSLPAEKLEITCGEKALFVVTTNDLTYGFGLFREDNSMVFQMQVVPGHVNDILWYFDKPGVYSIRSYEYSGPAGAAMVVKDAVVVSDVTKYNQLNKQI